VTTGRTRTVAAVACGLAVALLALPSCSQPGADDPSTDDRGSGATTAPAPVPEDPTLTASPRGTTLRVSGVVEMSPEDRCLTLAAPGRTWVLTGTVAGLEAGDRVTVRGRPDPDATTTCQRGPVLVVVEVERG
jgi:hypothetical protein